MDLVRLVFLPGIFFFPFYSECYLKALKNDMFLFGQQWFSCIEWIYLVYIVYVEAHAADWSRILMERQQKQNKEARTQS